MISTRTVFHPHLGAGRVLKTYMGGFEWEVEFETGRRFRLPAREFEDSSAADGQQGSAAGSAERWRPPPIVLDADQYRARQTLEALRLGIVPVQDVETLTIGLESERVSLDRALARGKEHGGDCQAIIGDYGFGKSHFVEMAARRALRENFVVASASLDLIEVPPTKAHEIYRALARSLRYPDTAERGLRPLLRKALAQPGVLARFIELSPIPEHCPLSAALRALEGCGSQSASDAIMQWISGQIRATADVKVCLRKPPALYTSGEVARQYTYLLSAISLLATLVSDATGSGYSGLAVLIDESEHYSLLRAAQRGRADAFFKAMIYAALGPVNSRVDPATIPDHSRVAYPLSFATRANLFFLFALTESENRMPVDAWLAPSQIVRLDDRFIERDIHAFCATLLRYHSLAYAYEPSPERSAAILSAAPAVLSRTLSQHRINLRELIRVAVTIFDLMFLHADYSAEQVLGELNRGLGL